MSFTTKSLKSGSNQTIKVQIVSRDIPVENTIGNATYILDFIRYLRQLGFEIHCTILNSSPNGKTPWYIIPPNLAAIANVSAKDNLRIGRFLLRFNSLSEWLATPLRAAYNLLLPANLKDIYRSARDERERRRGHATSQLWDNLATPEEIAFASLQFARFKPDVVVANYAWLACVLDAVPLDESVLKVILTHDILHKRFADFSKMSLDSEHSHWSWDKESAQLCKAQVLLAIQEEEAETFKEMAPSTKVICMPMSVVCHPQETVQVYGRCLFVGSSSPHNTYSLQWFLDRVWPIVLQLAPHCNLHVCGSVCEQIQGTFSNVRFLGRITNLKPKYDEAEVCLIPLILGSGLKIKLLEALSHGRACVSTTVGVQGLREIADRSVLVADSAEDFALAIHTLLTNLDKRQWMEEQARSYVTEKLSPQAAYQPFVEWIEQHLQQVGNRSIKQTLDNKVSSSRVLTSHLTPSKEK